MIHLDTTFLVDLLRESARGGRGPASHWLEAHPDEELAISVHVACELYAGAELAQDPQREREKVTRLVSNLQWTAADERFPLLYGRLFAELERRGQRIAVMDLLIATAAAAASAPVLTRNMDHFSRVPGLEVLSY